RALPQSSDIRRSTFDDDAGRSTLADRRSTIPTIQRLRLPKSSNRQILNSAYHPAPPPPPPLRPPPNPPNPPPNPPPPNRPPPPNGPTPLFQPLQGTPPHRRRGFNAARVHWLKTIITMMKKIIRPR